MDRVVVVIPYKYRYVLDEELSLVKTIYNDVEDVIFVKRPNPKHYVSLDKVDSLKNNNCSKIILMDKVKPSQIIGLMRITGKQVVDRVTLILEIFEMHAGSLEAKLQIELVRLKHQLPLIKESIRYAKLGELHGFLGSGRYGYEKYYTMLKRREAIIREKLEKIRRARNVRRVTRIEQGLPHIVIIGYTCAGKTTIFNKLTGYSKPVGPEPFTTLTPKSARINIDGYNAILIDTVGFIRDLPHEIVEAFYVTLEEITLADALVHVVDASKPRDQVLESIAEVERTLSKIGVHRKPVLKVLNKIDLNPNYWELIKEINRVYGTPLEWVIPISALQDVNLEKLYDALKNLIKVVTIGENIRTEVWP